MSEGSLSAEEFEEQYAARSGVTVAELRALGQWAEPCDCDESECEGWQMAGHHAPSTSDDERRVEDMTIDELIEASSLGTPEAKAIRARTHPDVARAIVAASRIVGERDLAEGILRKLLAQPHEVDDDSLVVWDEAGEVMVSMPLTEGEVRLLRELPHLEPET